MADEFELVDLFAECLDPKCRRTYSAAYSPGIPGDRERAQDKIRRDHLKDLEHAGVETHDELEFY